jgi:hypothetical protein
MITFQTFLVGLLITSTLTGLATEATKKILVEHNVVYRANSLAGMVALILSVLLGVGYIVFVGMTFTAQIVVYLLALVFMSWLCAMIGYDKVIQAVSQFKQYGKDDTNE